MRGFFLALSAMARRSGFGLFAKKSLAIMDCIVYSVLRGLLVSSQVLFQNTRRGLAPIARAEPMSGVLLSVSVCVVGACLSHMERESSPILLRASVIRARGDCFWDCRRPLLVARWLASISCTCPASTHPSTQNPAAPRDKLLYCAGSAAF